MNLSNVNTQSFRTICTLISAFLLFGSWGMFEKHLYIKAATGASAALIIIWLAFKPASGKHWALVICVLLLAMYIVGAVNR
ncbi:MAG TPA: hypothetical protein VGN20_28750 [Mucilaginibacter sp.]|jgi:hypothetical protein